MLDRQDDLINDVLVDSDLAKLIVPDKFKHTSKQGRIRRQQLLLGAKRLIEVKDIQDISLADVCEEAGIPRASAYHFFPNVNSLFLAIRFLNFMETFNVLEKVNVSNFRSWEGYITKIIQESVKVFNNEPTKNKLMYGFNTPDFDAKGNVRRVDEKMVGLLTGELARFYDLSEFSNLDDLFLIVYNISHSIFALSFRQSGYITEEMMNEAIKASISYLRCYLPENLPKKSDG